MKITLSKTQWDDIGKKAGWLGKTAQIGRPKGFPIRFKRPKDDPRAPRDANIINLVLVDGVEKGVVWQAGEEPRWKGETADGRKIGGQNGYVRFQVILKALLNMPPPGMKPPDLELEFPEVSQEQIDEMAGETPSVFASKKT